MKIATLKILILGGTHFLGIHLTEELVHRGHEVTLFNRGTRTVNFPVQQLQGDRDGNLEALRGYHWDAVIDTSGHLPRIVEQSAQMLSKVTNHYTFLSTIGVYKNFDTFDIDEHYPLATIADPTTEEITEKNYGALKALCEAKVQQYFPNRSLIVRSGLLVGSYDPTDRFTYWVRRIAKGGIILAPVHQQVQFIDARDLARWIVLMMERQVTGVYNATGPSYDLEHILQECQNVIDRHDPIIWVNEEFLIEQGVQDWVELPLWLSTRRSMPGFSRISFQNALRSGLHIRPLGETISSVLEWDTMREAPKLQAGLDEQKETKLLAQWKESQKMRIVVMSTPEEREASTSMRQKYFFDRIPTKDPYLWTFTHKEHLHFILYRASEIVGYAHIQLWPNHRAAIRIIVIDEQARGQGMGKYFMDSCEQTLKEQGITLLQTEASPNAYLFYKKLGYTEMPFNNPDGEPTHPDDRAMGKYL
jgi:2'-hydroxyisoflavone reductase